MIICHDIKVIFVAIPKTGTRSISNVLRKQFGGKTIREHEQIIPEEYMDYFSFCVVRNPYDRICSNYWQRCHGELDGWKCKDTFKKMSIDNTLENYLTVFENADSSWPQADWVVDNDIDQILRFETLEEGFNTLPFVTTFISLPTLNASNKPPWEEIVTPAARKKINKIFEKDFRLFNYEMKE